MKIMKIQMKVMKMNLNTKKSEIFVWKIGKFRGAAHSICNLRYKVQKNIPIVFHNGSVYDWHFIITRRV